MIHKAGAGPEPIPHKKLCMENLRDAITFSMSAGAKAAAARMAEQIKQEVWASGILLTHLFVHGGDSWSQDGLRQGVDSFYKHLPLLNMR